MIAPATAVALGLALGARHALEPDHLAAVGVLATDTRDARRGALLGAWWGLGHSASLLAVGVVLGVLEVAMPPRLADVFELGVAAMLIVLGARAIRRSLGDARRGTPSLHAHGATEHRHAGPAAHVHLGGVTLATRPLLVGILHGLAGSGALTALTVASLPSSASRVAFIALFGIGSIAGMTLLSGLAGPGMARLGSRPALARAVGAGAGVLSLGLGLAGGLASVERLVG